MPIFHHIYHTVILFGEVPAQIGSTVFVYCKIRIIIMVIFKCYFSGELIALSINKNNNGVNIALGKTNRLKALCMMQINA